MGYHQGAINHVFDTHAFAWTWDYGEFDIIASRVSVEWTIRNVLKSLKGLVKRLTPVSSDIDIIYGDASKSKFSKKFDVLITDPPYYNNVQYSELSDYFYVWFTKILSDIYPEAYNIPNTPKTNEAVANPVRHGSKKLAEIFYEEKMRDIFSNHYNILRDDGVFALWFAHKSGGAWSTTIQALLDAGFTITSLWGVRAEMALSLHISGKAALKTNIILTCRKRTAGGGYIQDIIKEIERRLDYRLEELEEYGIVGLDFLMAAQAEALKVASQNWPLKDPQGKMESKEILDYIMDQAVGHAVNFLTNKVAPQIVSVDAPTKFYVLVRHLYRDIISYDDARRMALACSGTSGVSDPVNEIVIKTGLGKLGSTQIGGESTKIVTLVEPWDRARKGQISDGYDATIIDYIHKAMAVLEEGGTTMEAAQAIAGAGSSACEVIKSLYQILPDRIQRGKGTVVNKEKTHLQTLLLSVCQEGLHLIARKQIEEDQTQKRMDDFPTVQQDRSRYDPILDQFLKGEHDYVQVTVEEIETDNLRSILNERIKSRKYKNKIKITHDGDSLFLEKLK